MKKKTTKTTKKPETANEPSLTSSINQGQYLIIVESPSKTKKIESYLGPNYKCVSSRGHLRTIDSLKSINKTKYEIDFSIIKEKESVIEMLKRTVCSYDKDKILIGTDDDREGLGIAFHICILCNLPIHTTRRIVFHEITQQALHHAVQNPTTIDMNIVLAQQARQVLDLCIGFKISPFLWKHLFNNKDASLSAGRCQTPALKLVFENEMEKRNTVPEQRYNIHGYFFTKNIQFHLNKQIENIESVERFLEESKKSNHKYVLEILAPKKSIKAPPKPFNTSQLLQTASNVLSLSPKMTMGFCQVLYQNGYITYMRTDSKKYSKDFLEKARTYIETTNGKEYVGRLDELENTNGINPHEAIRVTHIEHIDIDTKNEPKMLALYNLIRKNTIESCMSEAHYENNEIRIKAPQEYYYTYTVEKPIFLGWKQAKTGTTNETQEQNQASGLLFFFSSLDKQNITPNKIESQVSYHNKHSYYTEAGLIQKLEDIGIGRPSTFSMLVETIKERKYVEKTNIEGKKIECIEHTLENDAIQKHKRERVFDSEKNKLVIQPLGIATVEFLYKYFEPLFNYEYTKNMEDTLDNMTEDNYIKVCSSCNEEIAKLSAKLKKVEKEKYQVEDYEAVFLSTGLVLRKKNEEGEYEYKKIKKTLEIDLDKLRKGEYTVEQIQDINNDYLGEYQESPIHIRDGRFGYYLEWKDKKESLVKYKKTANEITLDEAISILDPENTSVERVLQSKNVMRHITDDMSIRKGKYGPYVYYKTASMKSPSFYSLKDFKQGYMKCDVNLLKKWIEDTYLVGKP
jgi:DNA topoisomerase-1